MWHQLKQRSLTYCGKERTKKLDLCDMRKITEDFKDRANKRDKPLICEVCWKLSRKKA